MQLTLKLAAIAGIVSGTLALPTVALAKPLAKPILIKPIPVRPNQPPAAVMDQFCRYLNDNYSLYLGDDQGACSYSIDPAGIRADGSDRFFLAKLSRGKQGTACRGILAFEIMQADCKVNKLYVFRRESGDGKNLNFQDRRNLGWERFEMSLYDPDRIGKDDSEPQSQKVLPTICK